jgi:hypothetical protein
MIKICYKLRNLNHYKLPALDRSIAGHASSSEHTENIWFFLSTFTPKITQRGDMRNGLKINCKWPLRHIGMGTMA